MAYRTVSLRSRRRQGAVPAPPSLRFGPARDTCSAPAQGHLSDDRGLRPIEPDPLSATLPTAAVHDVLRHEVVHDVLIRDSYCVASTLLSCSRACRSPTFS